MTDLIQLYPQPTQTIPFPGAYLAQDIRGRGQTSKRPFIYANFVVTLDGRIAIPQADQPGFTIPKNVANARDWRLFQELAAQADLIISSGRYLRDWAAGQAQEILQVDDPQFADLRDWRQAQGLNPQPDLAIVSNSLDFPIPDLLTANGRRAIIFTRANPDPARVKAIESQAGPVIVAGEKQVEGGKLVQAIAELGYQTIYSAAGPKIAHLLLADGVLDRLYLTQVPRLLGGDPFASIVEGPLLKTVVSLPLKTLYYDPAGLAGLGQLFACYGQ